MHLQLLWTVYCDKDYLSQFIEFSVVTSQYNGQFSSSHYIFVLMNVLFHAKISHSHWLQASIYSQNKTKICSGSFSADLNSQVHSVHSSNDSTLSNHRHVKKITCLAFSLAFSPFSNVVVQNYQLWWALLSSPYGFQLVDLTSQLAPGHMKAAYLELPVRKPLPEEFVANPQTHRIML